MRQETLSQFRSNQLIPRWHFPERKLLDFIKITLNKPVSEFISYQGEDPWTATSRIGIPKSGNIVTPNVLRYQASKVTIVRKGLLYLITSLYHLNCNDEFILITPFQKLAGQPDSFNSFDLTTSVAQQEPDLEFQNISKMVLIGTLAKKFLGDIWSVAFLLGIILHIISVFATVKRICKLNTETLIKVESTYSFIAIFDSFDNKIGTVNYRKCRIVKQTPEVICGGICPGTYAHLIAFKTNRICQSNSERYIDLKYFMTSSKPTINYPLIPLKLIQPGIQLSRLWFYSFVKVLRKKSEIPVFSTLFPIDEILQFNDCLSLLENVMIFGREDGIKGWLFLRSLLRFQPNSSKSWRTIFGYINNIRFFQPNIPLTINEKESLIGVIISQPLIIKIAGQLIIRKSLRQNVPELNYLINGIILQKERDVAPLATI